MAATVTRLTDRERQVVKEIVARKTQKSLRENVAKALKVSPSTLDTHIKTINNKLPPGNGSPIRRIVDWAEKVGGFDAAA